MTIKENQPPTTPATEKPPYAPPDMDQIMKSIPTPADKDFKCPECNGSGIIQKAPGNITGKFGMYEGAGIRDDIPKMAIINPMGGFESIPCSACLGTGKK